MVILMGFIGVTTMYAQEKPASPKYALSFGIADNFRLDKFIMDIGITKILDDEHQVRLFLSPRVSSTTENDELSYSTRTTEYKTSATSLGVGADYLWILFKEDGISLFAGPGLIFSFGTSKTEITTMNNSIDKTVTEVKLPFNNIGVRGSLGIEWMVSKRISIHSEYLMTGNYNTQKSETTDWVNGVERAKSTRKTTGYSLSTGVLFGVSIYL